MIYSARIKAADQAFEEFDFEPYVVEGSLGWKTSNEDNELTCLVFLEDYDCKGIKVRFRVGFKPNSTEITYVYTDWE